MTRLRDLPVTVVIVASIGVPLLSAVGLVTWASLDIARRNTVELTRDKAELVIASIIERTRGHLEPVSEQVAYLAGLISSGKHAVPRAIWPKESVHQSGSKREGKAQTFVAQEIAELSEHPADGHHAAAAPLA